MSVRQSYVNRIWAEFNYKLSRPARHPPGAPGRWSGLSETRAFTFNWRCRNEQIEAAFRLWLQKNRPSQWANDAKGEKVISLRVDLERLGKMRKIKQNPTQTDAENNKEARRALQCFRELFPKLTEYPLNWPWPVDTANTLQE